MDQTSNDPFMDTKDHSLREPRTDKHGASDFEIATKQGQILEENYDPIVKITVMQNPTQKLSFMPSSTTKRLYNDCRNSSLSSLRQNKTEMTFEALRNVPNFHLSMNKKPGDEDGYDE